jgi:hypothetical protein
MSLRRLTYAEQTDQGRSTLKVRTISLVLMRIDRAEAVPLRSVTIDRDPSSRIVALHSPGSDSGKISLSVNEHYEGMLRGVAILWRGGRL